MNNYYPEYNSSSYQAVPDIDTRVSQVMKRVYVKMTLALVVTALVSLYCATSVGFLDFFLNNRWFMWVLVAAEFGIVLGVSGGINRLSSSTATLLFYLFAVVNGMLLCPVFLLYTNASIAKTFFITAGVFGAMSVYGYFTSQNLARWGSFLIMALFGLIICSLINIFLHSSAMEWIISGAGVLIFIGLTAWDTQQIKTMAQMAPNDTIGKLATLGALSLYLDFINLFLYLLRFFGDRR
ncbi:MAG: Bax inhibitor-1/YccA family protein [Barnesiella sp.]|nr:Bax inhibitor-1/YccA family protein [Barnesiella sp.]